jgi:hypothetical protein
MSWETAAEARAYTTVWVLLNQPDKPNVVSHKKRKVWVLFVACLLTGGLRFNLFLGLRIEDLRINPACSVRFRITLDSSMDGHPA